MLRNFNSVRTHIRSLIQLRDINILWDSIIRRALWIKLWSRICPLKSHRFENDLYKTGAECRAWGEEAWRKPQHWRTCRGGILHALVPGPLYALSSQLNNLHAHGVDRRTQPLPGLPPKLKHGVCPWLWPLRATRITVPLLSGAVLFQSPSPEGLCKLLLLRGPQISPADLHSSSVPLHPYPAQPSIHTPVFLSLALHPSYQVLWASVVFPQLCLVAFPGDRKPSYVGAYQSVSLLCADLYQLCSSSWFCFLGTHTSSPLSTKPGSYKWKSWLSNLFSLKWASRAYFGEAQHWCLCSRLVTATFPQQQGTPWASMGAAGTTREGKHFQ